MAGAQAVYTLFGFGAGLIAVGGMALFLPDVTDVVVLLLLASVPSELFVVVRSRARIEWRGVATLILGIGPGILLGAHLLSEAEPVYVLTVLAWFLIVSGAAFLFLPRRARIRWPEWTGVPVGVVSGVLAGLFGTGGPPLILYYQLAGAEKERFRGHLMAIFATISVVRLPAYAVLGLITLPRLVSGGAILPAALLGAWLGHRIHLGLSELRFRQLVSVMLCLLGLLLLQR